MQNQNLLNIKNISIRINGVKLIDDLSLSLKTGDKLGLIGNEGNGKSILIKLMAGVKLSGGVNVIGSMERKGRIGYMSQELTVKEKALSPREYLIGSDWGKLNEMGRWHQIFQELGLAVDWLEWEILLNQCSGGEQVKLKLAKVLFDRPDILLMDEPTNYLDIETLEWLEGFCQKFSGGLMVISHDEMFLEKVTNRILHLERLFKRQKNVWRLENVGFGKYHIMRDMQFDKEVKESARQKRKHDGQVNKLKEIKHNIMMDQITIIDSTARRLLNKKMKTMVSQQERMESKELLKKPDKEKQIKFQFGDVKINPSKIWLDWRDKEVALMFGNVLIKDLIIKGKKKIFIIGANGSGKTQLLKKIKEDLVNRGIEVGYVPQDYWEILPVDKKVIDWLNDLNSNENLKTMLGWMNFGREEMDLKIGQLSSGQKMKVMLLALKIQSPDILLLDEPMSNLSLFSRQELRQAIKNLIGPAMVVTHDRKFIDAVADRVYEIKNNELIPAQSTPKIATQFLGTPKDGNDK